MGWHTARTLLPPPPPRSSGAPVRWLTARGRRASGVAAAPRSRAAGAPATRRPAAGAPWEARARAARVQTAGEDLVVVVVVWWCAHQLRITSGRLPLIGGSIRCCPVLRAPTDPRGGGSGRSGNSKRNNTAKSILPQILGSLPEVIRSCCHHHHHHTPPKIFAERCTNARSRGALAFTSQPPEPSGGRPWEVHSAREAPLEPSLATFDRPAVTPGT